MKVVDSSTLHSFKVGAAQKVGVNAAVLLDGIVGWVRHNAANGSNYNDGYYWTYNSVRAWAELYPYMTEKQVRTALKKLEDAGYVISGSYNKKGFDKTKWYAVTDRCLVDCGYVAVKGESIRPQGQMDLPSGADALTSVADGLAHEGEPIPTTYQLPTQEEKNNARAREESPLTFHGGDPEPFTPPTVEEVRAYCQMNGMPDDAERFVAHYAALGWRKGSTPIRDWKPLVTLWNLNGQSWRAEKASRGRSGWQEKPASASSGLSVPIPDPETREGRETLLRYYNDGTVKNVSAVCWDDLRWAYKQAIDALIPFPPCPDYDTADDDESDEYFRLWNIRSDITTSDAAKSGDVMGCLKMADELLGEEWTSETRGLWLDL